MHGSGGQRGRRADLCDAASDWPTTRFATDPSRFYVDLLASLAPVALPSAARQARGRSTRSLPSEATSAWDRPSPPCKVVGRHGQASFVSIKTCAVQLPCRYAAHAWMYTVQKRISWRWHLLACCSSTASSDCMQSSQRASNTATAFREAAHVQASVTSSHVQVTSPRLARQLVSW